MSLKEKAMIVDLTVNVWTARKKDKKAEKTVEEAFNAKNAGSYTKHLMQSATLDKINTQAGKIRNFVYDNTLPWGQKNTRLLATTKYFSFLTGFGALKLDFVALVDQFIDEYIEEINKVESSLNGLFNPQDYPSIDNLRRKFGATIAFFPISDGDDLRVKISEDVENDIRKQITSEVNKRIENSMQDIFRRVHKVVLHMQKTLEEKDKTFKDSLVDNVAALIEDLPLLNFNNDVRVDEVITLCKNVIVNPSQLRKNVKFRAEIATKAKLIVEKLKECGYDGTADAD